ncbi:hypothetical protein AWM68_14160 [Fictibacillus phosphorivorans]|uniref:Uncharacterized protein n=1 Tax=Fictibacillus phosphorivorans TaxID=1221500 RepID=A0A161RSB6_9BACL|nr:DUF6470 family protein [Fictibacillus phosphorivorans]KZE64239.1 hypothetical protein AWM68_14160 [Fictibacillus phosphorivorans]
MNVPQLRLESTNAKIGLSIQQPIQEIQQAPADLQIKQPKADLEVKRTPSQLTIDQTEAWADMDLKHISRRIEEFAQQGYEDWLTGLARMSQEGDDLMRVENGGNPIPDQAKVNSESPIYEFNIGFIPRANSVKINYQPSEVQLNWQTHKPEIDVKINRPIHQYTPGKVNVSMEQMPSLTINWTT